MSETTQETGISTPSVDQVSQGQETREIQPAIRLSQFESQTNRMTIYEFTPEVADQILRYHHFKNRPFDQSKIQRYTVDMANGQWIFNGDPLRFLQNGMLVDGQNRLQACINSKANFESGVALGLVEDAISKIDMPGQSRTIAQILQIMNLSGTEATVVAAAVKLIKMYDDNNMNRTRGKNVVDPTYVTEFVKHNRIINDISRHAHAKVFRQIAEPSIIAAMWFILYRINRVKANQFFSQLGTLEAGTHSSVHALYLRLNKMKTENSLAVRKKWEAVDQFAVTIHAWNNFILDNQVVNLQGARRDDNGNKVLPEITRKSYTMDTVFA